MAEVMRQGRIKEYVDIQNKYFDFYIGRVLWGYSFEIRIFHFGFEIFILSSL